MSWDIFSLIINPAEAATLEKGGFKLGTMQDMKMTALLLKCLKFTAKWNGVFGHSALKASSQSTDIFIHLRGCGGI